MASSLSLFGGKESESEIKFQILPKKEALKNSHKLKKEKKRAQKPKYQYEAPNFLKKDQTTLGSNLVLSLGTTYHMFEPSRITTRLKVSALNDRKILIQL